MSTALGLTDNSGMQKPDDPQQDTPWKQQLKTCFLDGMNEDISHQVLKHCVHAEKNPDISSSKSHWEQRKTNQEAPNGAATSHSNTTAGTGQRSRTRQIYRGCRSPDHCDRNCSQRNHQRGRGRQPPRQVMVTHRQGDQYYDVGRWRQRRPTLPVNTPPTPHTHTFRIQTNTFK